MLNLDKQIEEITSKLNAKDKSFVLGKYRNIMDIVKNGGDIQKEIKEIKEYDNNKS